MLDRHYIIEIDAYMRQYEEENNIQITKVGFCKDASITRKYYDDIKNMPYSELLTKAFIEEWSDYTSINYHTGRKLIKVDVPEKIQNEFIKMDWIKKDLYNQIVFDGDTAYICVY